MAMMYFLPSDEFQIREKRFISFAASDECREIYRWLAGSVNGCVFLCVLQSLFPGVNSGSGGASANLDPAT
jgi:hypothetical protein